MFLPKTLPWLAGASSHLPVTSPGFPGFKVGGEWCRVGFGILSLCRNRASKGPPLSSCPLYLCLETELSLFTLPVPTGL